MTTVIPEPDAHNAWRLTTPGNEGWTRSARPDATDKYFMVSTDGHVIEPNDLWSTRVAEKYRDRLPGVVEKPNGEKFQKTEGFREPLKLKKIDFQGEDLLRNKSGKLPEGRIADLRADGVDAEIMFPNKGLTMWATRDPLFSHAMCRAFNDWAWETFSDYNDRLAPMACLAPAALDETLAEIQRCAALGFRGLSLPCKPQWGPPDVDEIGRQIDPNQFGGLRILLRQSPRARAGTASEINNDRSRLLAVGVHIGSQFHERPIEGSSEHILPAIRIFRKVASADRSARQLLLERGVVA